MALYTKQEFCPPILSRRWIAMKFRPNMLVSSRKHVVSILESGLLFREDCIELEQEMPSPEEMWKAAGGGHLGWMTRGETVASLTAIAVCVAAFPPKSLQKSALLNLALYAAVPAGVLALRARASGSLSILLDLMRRYLALARRAQACIKENMALNSSIAVITSVLESTHTMLCRQQSELSVLMSRASSALLGNVPWLRGDVAWHAVAEGKRDDLVKIHHAFLVVQSTLLKHTAMAHFPPTPHEGRVYKNHNERLYWIHSVLIQNLVQEFKQNLESLDRMYRMMRNVVTGDYGVVKRPGSAMVVSWAYSDIHNGVARTSMELKMVANKCNDLDVFLDNCALNRQEIDLEVLSKDLDGIIGDITKCLSSMQNADVRLRKLKGKVEACEREPPEETRETDDGDVIRIEDKDLEVEDEVFYCVKTEDDEVVVPPTDVTTGPGVKEREATKIVLGELRRKLGKREDVMRERERRALRRTMPEFGDDTPEFPKQIVLELEEREEVKVCTREKKKKKTVKKRLFRYYRIKRREPTKKYRLHIRRYTKEADIKQPFYEANANLDVKRRLISVSIRNRSVLIIRWMKCWVIPDFDSNISEGLSDVEESRREQNGHRNGFDTSSDFKFTRRDLELSNSSGSESEGDREGRMALLKDVRRHRVARKKNHPDRRVSVDRGTEREDEGLRPVEYSFGTGMALASVLKINTSAKLPNMVQEEVFVGDGEVSADSGNDEDA